MGLFTTSFFAFVSCEKVGWNDKQSKYTWPGSPGSRKGENRQEAPAASSLRASNKPDYIVPSSSGQTSYFAFQDRGSVCFSHLYAHQNILLVPLASGCFESCCWFRPLTVSLFLEQLSHWNCFLKTPLHTSFLPVFNFYYHNLGPCSIRTH